MTPLSPDRRHDLGRVESGLGERAADPASLSSGSVAARAAPAGTRLAAIDVSAGERTAAVADGLEDGASASAKVATTTTAPTSERPPHAALRTRTARS